MFAAGWDHMRPPSRAEQVVSRPPQHTLANPKMILTFSQSSLSHCGWAANNFTASCVAAAPQLRRLHTQLISWTSLTSWVNATSQVREAPGDAEMKSFFFPFKSIPTVLACPLIWMIKAPLWMRLFTGVALTGQSYSWQGAWEQMVVAAAPSTRSLGGRRRLACFH